MLHNLAESQLTPIYIGDMRRTNDLLTRNSAEQQPIVPSNYQELEAFVRQQTLFWRDRDAEWREKITQDNDWKIAVDGKLQTIINFLNLSVPTPAAGTSQTVATSFPAPYFGKCLL